MIATKTQKETKKKRGKLWEKFIFYFWMALSRFYLQKGDKR